MNAFLETWFLIIGTFYTMIAMVLLMMALMFFMKIGPAKTYQKNANRRGRHYLWLAVASSFFAAGAFMDVFWLRVLGATLYVADFVFHLDLRSIGDEPLDKEMVKSIRISLGIVFGIILKCLGLVMIITLIV